MLHRIRHDCVSTHAVFALDYDDRDNAINQVNRQAHLFVILAVTADL
jgi:hypothetical protein